jgi:hypothetical protein
MEPFIDHSRVRALLASHGYQTVSISTGYTITDNQTADLYLHPRPVVLTDFEGYLLDVTALRLTEPLLRTFALLPTSESHRATVLHGFRALEALAEAPGPKFVFAHLISPHPPFVFDGAGSPLDSPASFTFQDANEFPGSSEDYARQYTGQVKFVNDRLQEVIETLLARSSAPPIILIQADHGSGLLTDLGSPQDTCIRERFSPFAAYYLPGVDLAAIPSDISTVNLFRIVFNEYFEAGLPLLDDRQYFYQDMQNYYRFEEVTGRYDNACILPGK